MKIELKNIKHSPSLSEETEAFTANIYIDDVLAGYASNRGHGGPTDYDHANEKGRELIKQAEEYCKKLPPTNYPASHGMEAFSVPMDLENYIDDLLNKHLEQKELQKFNRTLEKHMERGVVFGIAGHSFGAITYKIPLTELLKKPTGAESLKNTIIKSIAPQLIEGKVILNTNIPESILKEAGLSKDQYVQQPEAKQQGQKQKAEKKNSRKI